MVNDQEEIHGLDKTQWEGDSWKRLSLIGDETIINLHNTIIYVFSDCVSWENPSTSRFQRNLEKQSSKGQIREKLQIMTVSMKNRSNSSGTFL